MRVLWRGYKAECCFTWRCAPCREAGDREREIEDRRVSYTVQRPIRVDLGVGQDLVDHHLSIDVADVADASDCSPWAVGCCNSTVRLRCYGWIRWRAAAEAGLCRRVNWLRNCDDPNCFHDLLVKEKKKCRFRIKSRVIVSLVSRSEMGDREKERNLTDGWMSCKRFHWDESLNNSIPESKPPLVSSS